MSLLPDPIGVSTVAWDEWELSRALERAAQYAVLVEIYSGGVHSLLSPRNRAAALASGLGFTVHGPYDGLELGSLRERSRRAAVAEHRRNLEAAAEIGARCYVVHPDFAMKAYRVPSPSASPRRAGFGRRRTAGGPGTGSAPGPGGYTWGWDPRVQAALQRSFAELEEAQREVGVRVGVENMPAPGHSHFHGPDDLTAADVAQATVAAAAAVACGEPSAAAAGGRGLDLGGLGLVLDAGHAAVCGTLQAFLAAPPTGLVHVHLHDNKGLEESGDPHLALGEGVVDVAGVLRVARRAGATVILELAEEERLRRSIAYLELERLLVDFREMPPDVSGEVLRPEASGTDGQSDA